MRFAVCIAACLAVSSCTYPPGTYDYKLEWKCKDGTICQWGEQLERIDVANKREIRLVFHSTHDPDFYSEGIMFPSAMLPPYCSMVQGMAFFGQELEPWKFCKYPNGFVGYLRFLNSDGETYSEWEVFGDELL